MSLVMEVLYLETSRLLSQIGCLLIFFCLDLFLIFSTFQRQIR